MRIKKLLALFLSMSLIVCSISSLVFADEVDDQAGAPDEVGVEDVGERGKEPEVVDGDSSIADQQPAEPEKDDKSDVVADSGSDDGTSSAGAVRGGPDVSGQNGDSGDAGDAPVIVTTTSSPIGPDNPIGPDDPDNPDDPDVYVYSGSCGNGVYFSFDPIKGELSITGSGAMINDDSYGWAMPWHKYGENIVSVSIENGVTHICHDAFAGLENITSIVIPDSVISIDDSAFTDCSSLTSIAIPNGVNSIGFNAFEGCSSLTHISIPEGVTKICIFTFSGCRSLTSITIPDSVTSIDGGAFLDCESLTSITIPDSVKSIKSMAFAGCSSLVSLTIPDSVTSIEGQAFSGCSSLTSISIPKNIDIIDDYTFDGCCSLSSIIIPNNVTKINLKAFAGCSSLTSITIPNSVTYIGDNVFSSCDKLVNIICNSDPSSFSSSAFAGIPDNTKIIVKHEYLEAYKQKFGEGYNFVDASLNIGVLGHQIGLGNQIGIDFYLNVPSEIDVSELSVSFSWGTGNYAKTATGTLVSTTANGANYYTSCGIAARCMTDEVTMTIKKGDDVYATNNFKVVDYVEKLVKMYPAEDSTATSLSNLNYNQRLHLLLLTMLDYGTNSQLYFNYRTDDLAGNYNDDLEDVGVWRYEIKSAYKTYSQATINAFDTINTIKNIGNDNIGITYNSAAVACTSKTSVKFYFNKADGFDLSSLSASYKGKALTFHEEGDLVYVEIAGIAPMEYAPTGTDLYDCSITLTINGKAYSYNYLYYVYRCVDTNNSFKETAVALAVYSYFATHLGG